MKASLSWIIISIILVSMFASVFGIYISKMNAEYGIVGNQTVTIESYNKMTAINSNVQDIKNGTLSLKENQGVLDKIGALFSNAYNVLIITPQSVDLMTEMSNDAVVDANLGEGGEVIRVALIAILIVIVFVTIILAILLKTNL